jgi:hypothetical protein
MSFSVFLGIDLKHPHMDLYLLMILLLGVMDLFLVLYELLHLYVFRGMDHAELDYEHHKELELLNLL